MPAEGSRLRQAARAVLIAAALLAGCSDEYAHERIERGSPRFERARAMIAALREDSGADDDATLQTQIAGDLAEEQRTRVSAALKRLAEAAEAKLIRMDRFGKGVFRATIRLKEDGREYTLAMLLVAEADALRWAGRN